MILTSRHGKNEETFSDIMQLYAKPGDVIADVTFGKGNFWKKVDESQFTLHKSDLSLGVDFRHLPYGDKSIDITILDPPYIYNPKHTIKTSISQTYHINETLNLETNGEILDLYHDGLKENYRVLKQKGYSIVKCQDVIEGGVQKWNHIHIHAMALTLGFVAEDLFVVTQTTVPCQRWKIQKHARKNHSYFWVFVKK